MCIYIISIIVAEWKIWQEIVQNIGLYISEKKV